MTLSRLRGVDAYLRNNDNPERNGKQMATSKTWNRTLEPEPEKPRPWKTWTLKNLDHEKHEINMELKDFSHFRELYFRKIMCNVICCLKVR